ncbi:MAG: hypothetical protein U1E76_14220 [Planctomycetota bacterium]
MKNDLRWLWLVALIIVTVLVCIVARCLALRVALPDWRWMSSLAALAIVLGLIPLGRAAPERAGEAGAPDRGGRPSGAASAEDAAAAGEQPRG